MKEKPREFTADEIRNHFLDRIRARVDYWVAEKEEGVKSRRDRLENLVLDILMLLDGGFHGINGGLPPFIVAPLPFLGDRKKREGSGRNWYPENREEVPGDISAVLSEYWLG